MLTEFARAVATDFPVHAVLDLLVRQTAVWVPAGAATVTVLMPASLAPHMAASVGPARGLRPAVTRSSNGPPRDAGLSGEAATAGRLPGGCSYPELTAVPTGVEHLTVSTFPLRHNSTPLGVLTLRSNSGVLSPAVASAAQILADAAAGYLLNATSRADLQLSVDRSQHAALHDELTGLPNGALLTELLERAVLRHRRTGKTAAVFYLDLDRFKGINDSYGHDTGDELLTAVGRRLTAHIRPPDTVARLHGDEFVILCEDLDDPVTTAHTIGARIHAALRQPFGVADRTVTVTASVGVAFAHERDSSGRQVLHHADTAMYQAKRGGGNRQHIYDGPRHTMTHPGLTPTS